MTNEGFRILYTFYDNKDPDKEEWRSSKEAADIYGAFLRTAGAKRVFVENVPTPIKENKDEEVSGV